MTNRFFLASPFARGNLLTSVFLLGFRFTRGNYLNKSLPLSPSLLGSRSARGKCVNQLLLFGSRFARGNWQILISDKIRTAGKYSFPSGLNFPIWVPFSHLGLFFPIWVHFFLICVHFFPSGFFFQSWSVSSHLGSFFPCYPIFPSDPLSHVGSPHVVPIFPTVTHSIYFVF